jgi:hypothetical protein
LKSQISKPLNPVAYIGLVNWIVIINFEEFMSQTNLKKIQTLEQQIAVSRRHLQDLYDAKGYTDSEVLAAKVYILSALIQESIFKDPSSKSLLVIITT